MLIVKFLKKIIYREKYSSTSYIKYLKKKGIQIGNNCRIFNPKNINIDLQNPKLIKIGNNVKITSGVIILTHDYSWSVLAVKYDEIFGNVSPVKIGNNVFIGMNAIILKNTNIGDNVIIGAGSVVSGNIESNSVYCGNPAKKIMTLEQFYKKIKERQLSDLDIIKSELNIDIIDSESYENEFFEYFYLFKDKNKFNINEKNQIKRAGNYDKIIKKLK